MKIRVGDGPRSIEPEINSTGDFSACTSFVLESQEQSNWCWAAIAASLARYYGVGEFTQHGIAMAVLSERIEGELMAPSQINMVASLEDALRHVQCTASWSPGRPSLREIASEITAGRPVCVCLQWQTGDAHYVVLTGCAAGTGELTVEDPLHGRSLQNFNRFPKTYRSAGTVWRGVYWTGPRQGS